MGKGDIKTLRGKISQGTYGVRRKRKNTKKRLQVNKRFCCYCGEIMIRRKKAAKEKTYPHKGETVDHIPQQCLFDGYGDKYKLNRITVPSCRECNDNFAKIEEDIRDLIGVANNDNDAQQALTKKGVKAIFNKKNWQDRIYTDDDGKVRGVEINYARLEINHIKNFKGIFFEEYKQRVPDDYVINIIDKPNTHETVNYILAFLERNGSWGKSGNEDIFRYKIVPYKNINGEVTKTSKLSDSLGVFSLLEYHKTILILVVSFKKGKIIKKI